ncbi:MAG TPA: TolC family protein [Terriglobia bacterium]|nr:TolC family protein [Terriglobia bacterium]
MKISTGKSAASFMTLAAALMLRAPVAVGQTVHGVTGPGAERLAVPASAAALDRTPTGPEAQALPAEKEQQNGGLNLEGLEKMALKNNPTLAQSQADIRASGGRKIQAGLYPNPLVGYEGREISSGPIIRGGEHGIFVQQSIVTFGKLGLSRKVFAQEQAQAESVAAAQRQRVLNAVQLAYYQALGAQELVRIQGELVRIARSAVQTTEQLLNVGQADRPDMLEAMVEAQHARLGLMAARNDQQRIWEQLAATVGEPSLPLTPLAGRLDDLQPPIDAREALARLLRDSPEVKLAEQGIVRAGLALKRAKIEPRPDIQVGAGLDYNRELFGEAGSRPVGWEGSVQVGIRIPIFNRNQGNVKAAAAEAAHARSELERVRLSLRSSFAPVFRDYSDALETSRSYQKDMLPQAQEAYDLYLEKYRQMAAAYPQVLIAQRTLFQLKENYVKSLVSLRVAATQIQGFLLVDGLAVPIAPGEPATVSPGIEVQPTGMP